MCQRYKCTCLPPRRSRYTSCAKMLPISREHSHCRHTISRILSTLLRSAKQNFEGLHNHISGMSVARHLKRLFLLRVKLRRTRPCTEVRILPLHFDFGRNSAKLHKSKAEELTLSSNSSPFAKGSGGRFFPFEKNRHCSHL